MKKSQIFSLNVDQAKKINHLLPKGYKVVSAEEYKKKVNQSKKKIKIYQPVEEVFEPIQPRRARKQGTGIYFEGDDEAEEKRNVNLNSEREASNLYEENYSKSVYPEQISVRVGREKSAIIPPANQYSASPQATPVEVIITAKEVIQEMERNEKFRVIRKFQEDHPDKCEYESIVEKTQSNMYGLQKLLNELQEMFGRIYRLYSRSSEMYSESTELERDILNLVNCEKTQQKYPRKGIKFTNKQSEMDEEIVIPDLSRNISTQKKKTLPIKSDLKSITIMDKRILGQNIKKLPSEYLSEICRIVYDTIETREEYIIDIESLPHKKVKQLQIYVNSCIQKIGEFELENQDKNDDSENSSQSSFIITNDDDSREIFDPIP